MARIVIVDDDELICTIVARTLAPHGHVVVPVRDGDDALDHLWDSGADLLILDCALPGKTGMTILREIRHSAMFHALPVLILTARRSEWHAKLALDEGANAYVRKPFEPGDMIAEVDRLLAERAAPAGSGTLLDPARLADLRSAVGLADTDRLLAMMLRDIATRTTEISTALAAGDTAAARREAHTLRGASDGIGAIDLARCCHAIERGAALRDTALTACAAATVAAIETARVLGAQETTSSACSARIA